MIIADLSDRPGARVAAEISRIFPKRAFWLPLDLREEHSISEFVGRVVQEHGGIDILVCNAATFSFRPLEEWSNVEALDRHYAVGLRGHTLLVQNAWQRCPRSKAGSVIAISSVAGHVGEPNAFAYTPIKAALRGFTLSCAIDMAKSGGWAVTLSPGHTWSVPHQERASAEGMTREQYEQSSSSIQSTMFGRFLEPEEVARWVVLLASPLGKALTGQEINATFGIEAGGFNRSYRTTSAKD